MVELFVVADKHGSISHHYTKYEAKKEVGLDSWLIVVRVWMEYGIVKAEMVDDSLNLLGKDKVRLLEMIKDSFQRILEDMQVLKDKVDRGVINRGHDVLGQSSPGLVDS